MGTYIDAQMVAYIVGIYSGLWALGYGIGKSVAWVRYIKTVA